MKTEEGKLFKKLGRKMMLTIREQNLLEDNDRLLVGLSGGKDSLIMLELLKDRIKALPFHVEMFAVHIAPENIGYKVNPNYLKDFVKNLGISLIWKTTSPDIENSSKSACFICSWERRKAIFKLSEELNCNKLAFGHHRDDALQTFLMNLLYHGSISALPYSLSMFKGRIKLIRPLLDIWEKELTQFASYKSFEHIEKSCPHENLTKRHYTDQLIKQLEESYPLAKINIFKALDNIYPEYLPHNKKKSNKNSGEIM